MGINLKNEDLRQFIDGSYILEMIFGEEALQYSYAFSNPTPTRLKPTLQALRDFEGWVEDAMRSGVLKAETTGETFYLHEWRRATFDLWMRNNGILKHLEDNGVKIDDDLKEAVESTHTTTQEPPEASYEKPGKSLRTNDEKTDQSIPKPTGWNQITFCVLDDARMEITAAGEIIDESSLKKKIPDYLWKLFFNIVIRGNPFDNTTFNVGLFKKEYMARLRKHLKLFFGLNDDPIPYNKKANQYQPKFHCESELSNDSFLPEDATPPGVPRKIQDTKWSRDQHLK